MDPQPIEQELPPQRGGGLRATAYIGLVALLLTAGWSRFGDRIAAFYPDLAGPAPAAVTNGVAALAELPLLSAGEAAQALPGLNLPAAQQALLAADLRRGRLGLVRVPVFDASATAGTTPPLVTIATAGYSRAVPLTRTPVVLTLPIDRVGNIGLQTNGHQVDVGMVTMAGPVVLPPISSGDHMDVGVVAQ